MTSNPPPTTATTTSSTTTTTTATIAAAAVCTNCCSDDRLLLHCVRLRGVYRKLCTSCVLKLHPTSFCPTCFSLHDVAAAVTSAGAGNKTLTCFKCSSISHSSCVPPNAPRSPFLCFLCTNPNFKFFEFRKEKGDEKDNRGVTSQTLDERSARVLVAAARIASMSMNKAAASARAEADKKVREAALARKRAKEAIDYVMSVSARVGAVVGGVKRRESEVSVAVRTPVGPLRLEKNGGVGRVNMTNVGPTVGGGVSTPEVKNANGVVGMGGVGGGVSLQSNGGNGGNNGGNLTNNVGVGVGGVSGGSNNHVGVGVNVSGGNANNHVGVGVNVVSGGSDKKDGALPQAK